MLGERLFLCLLFLCPSLIIDIMGEYRLKERIGGFYEGIHNVEL